jgi:hypothetical protein
LFVDETSRFVTVVEIKNTDWNRIRSANRRRLLGRHQRQVWNYIEKFLDVDRMDVCAGIIYPHPPARQLVRDEIEQFLNDRGLQVVWFEDQATRS